jgi:hypothetical protein
MILKIHSDVSYLSEAKTRSRAGGHFYLGDKPSDVPEQGNGALLTKSTIVENVMSLAAKAKCGAAFENTTDDPLTEHTPQNGASPTTHPRSS